MTARLVKRDPVTHSAWYLEFALDEEITFHAGQFFQLTLDLANPDDRGNHRFFGFTNSPTHNRLAGLLTWAGVSAFKQRLAGMAIGDAATVDHVGGALALPPSPDTPMVIVTSGIGIAPFMSIFRFAAEKSLPYTITLLYSNASREAAPYIDELESYAQSNPRIKVQSYLTPDEIMPEDFIKSHLSADPNTVYGVTGTPHFTTPTVQSLKNLGVPPDHLHLELFTGY